MSNVRDIFCYCLVVAGLFLGPVNASARDLKRANEKNNEVEFSMSQAKPAKMQAESLDDYYGERDNSKNYRFKQSSENDEEKKSRHQWRRIDPYSEED